MRKRPLTKLTLTACTTLACLWLGMESQSSAQNPATRNPQRAAPDDGTVRAPGSLYGADSLEFRSLVPGETIILAIAPNGSFVQKGDLLVELDSSLIKEQIQQQQIVAVTAEADTAQAATELEITKLQGDAALAELKAALSQQSSTTDLADIELEANALEKRLSTLAKKTALVRKQQETQVESAKEGLELNLMLLDFETESQIIKEKLEHLKSNVLPQLQELQTQRSKMAEHKLLVQKLRSDVDNQQAQAAYQARQFVAKAAQEQLETLQQQLEHCRIVAPRDGIVVHANQSFRRAEPIIIEEGASVRERQLLVTMPDLEHLQMNMRVHESNIARVKKGQTATITFDALPNRKFQGTVTSVADKPFPSVLPNNGAKEFEVIVSLEKSDPLLKLGMSGLVEIDVSK